MLPITKIRNWESKNPFAFLCRMYKDICTGERISNFVNTSVFCNLFKD